MSRYFNILIISLITLIELNAQNQGYLINPAQFSSRIYNEFSPLFFHGGIVFCSDLADNSLVNYSDGQKRPFSIFYVMKKSNTGWTRPRILAAEITTAFNDGPATFSEDGNIMYYTRNNTVDNSLRNISDTSNKLGIYSAELINDTWTNIKPFPYNNLHYSLYTPALAPGGKRIYFSSNMPGGFGGMDLYYCDMLNKEWGKPVNMGPLINTPQNESFPFESGSGKIYFASDGHKGYGGKDIFYTRQNDGGWIIPVNLDSAINSPADDFGILVDSTYENGFFSTNRRGTDDIFSFNAAPAEFTSCDTMKTNKYCFKFYDEKQYLIDTIPVIYQWDFGDETLRFGKEVNHCFPGPGKYTVRLSIFDEQTGDTITYRLEYKVELQNIEQAYIKSDNTGPADKPISFEAVTTDLKNKKISDYFWDFGDGFKPGGQFAGNTFKKKGEYEVKLGLLTQKDSLGIVSKICVMKKVKIN